MESLADWSESQFPGYAIAVPLEERGADLEDLLTVVADDLSLVRIFLRVGHVVHRAGANIDFTHEIALNEDRQGAVNGRPRNSSVDFAGLIQQFFGGEVRRFLEYGFEDCHALASHAQVVLYQVPFELFSAVVDRHVAESQYILNSCQPRRGSKIGLQ